MLPDPQLLIQPLVRREAVLSSRIEGTQASLADLVAYESAGTDSGDAREVSNYVEALNYGLERLERLPLSLRFIREIHERLMRGVRGGDRTPGEFRRIQNWIGPPAASIGDATYIPPPVAEMHRALDALEKFIHAPSPLPPLVKAALIHYQFEAIHPFLDCNGRVGRLLIAFVLRVDGVLEQPLLYLSGFFERHRREYYRLLLAVSSRGAWIDWISFFLRGVAQEARGAGVRIRALIELREKYRRSMSGARNAGALQAVVDQLFVIPAVSVTSLAKRLDVSYPAAKSSLDKLVQAGIVWPTKQGRETWYFADEIIRTVEAP
jgi:Fic family protein